MNTATLNPTDVIDTIQLTYSIDRNEDNGVLILNEGEEIAFEISYNATIAYDRPEADTGYLGGYYVDELSVMLNSILDENGDKIPFSAKDRRYIEKFLSENLNLEINY